MSIDNFIAQFNYWSSKGEYNEFTLYLCRLFLKIEKLCITKFDDSFLGLDRPFHQYQMHKFKFDWEINELTVGTIEFDYTITSSEKRESIDIYEFEQIYFRQELQDFNLDLREKFKNYFDLSYVNEEEFHRHIHNALNWLWIANMEIEKEEIEKKYNKLNSHVVFIKNLFKN